MLSPLDRLLSLSGRKREDLGSNTRLGRMVRSRGVEDSAELQRIAALPRRVWEEEPDLEETVDLLTEFLKAPGGQMRLLPVQAIALREAHDYGCLMAPVPVGEGKTLLSVLLPTLLEAKRPLLLLPAKLIGKTDREIAKLKADWRIFAIELMSYERLSLRSGEAFLRSFRPDLIIGDEFHRCKDPRRSRWRKLARYLEEFPTTLIPMSGTFTNNSLLQFDHIQKKALRPELQILPTRWTEVRHWADALDVDVKGTRRMSPGALKAFCADPEEARTLGGIRRAFGRRVCETPAIVSSRSGGVACSLSIQGLLHDDYAPEAEEHFQLLHEKWQTPDEWEIQDAIVKWSQGMQMALEFYYRENPRPPREWLLARKMWHRFIRESLDGNRQGWDTELDIANACARGRLPDGLRQAWRAIEPTHSPNVEAIWFGDTVLKRCRDWLREHGGICFVTHIEFGDRLSELAGVPYFGKGGLDRKGRSIEDHPGGPIIASIAANSEGRNLQEKWSKALVAGNLGTGSGWQQLLGRLHRQGQKADEVEFWLLLGCTEQMKALTKAFKEAQHAQDLFQDRQKLLLADNMTGEAYGRRNERSWRWYEKDP